MLFDFEIVISKFNIKLKILSFLNLYFGFINNIVYHRVTYITKSYTCL